MDSRNMLKQPENTWNLPLQTSTAAHSIEK